MTTNFLAPELLQKIDAYWRAANYLSVGQIYLRENPLLRRPLVLADIKHMLLGHWGTTPGQNFIYAHLNRVIKEFDLDMIYVSGPGQQAFDKRIKDLENQKNKLRNEIHHLRHITSNAWEDLAEGCNSSWIELKTALKKTADEFKS
jgi:hypothetical protein